MPKAKNGVRSVEFYRVIGEIGERERDMLRYDFAFVREHDYEEEGPAPVPHQSPVVAFPIMRDGSGSQKPTTRRWESFGLKLRPIRSGAHSVREGEQVVCPHGDECWNEVDFFHQLVESFNEEGWITYRHPRGRDDRRDYSRLVPVPLRAFTRLDLNAPLGDADPVA